MDIYLKNAEFLDDSERMMKYSNLALRILNEYSVALQSRKARALSETITAGGEYYEIYEALIKAWCLQMHLPTDDETVSKYFRLNLERGIAHLCGTGFIKSTDDLIRLAIK